MPGRIRCSGGATVPLIITRTSACYALMVTDRHVTADGASFDFDVNKNIIFGDRHSVVAIAYSGMTYVGSVPTDQWLAQTLSGHVFPERRHGRGTVPLSMDTHFEDQPFDIRALNIKNRLDNTRNVIAEKYRQVWKDGALTVLISGFEWDGDEIHPYFKAISKPRNADTFKVSAVDRSWWLPQGTRFPVHLQAAPRQYIEKAELVAMEQRLSSVWGDGHGTWNQVADDAETLLIETFQNVSAREPRVGSDIVSILIPHPSVFGPTIRIRYVPKGQNMWILDTGGTSKPIPVAFSPWVVSDGCIRPPAIFANLELESHLGPYRVVMEGPSNPRIPGATNQERPKERG